MVSAKEKLSARKLCKCGHWEGAHDTEGECHGLPVMTDLGSSELCPCMQFRPAVHPQLTEGKPR